MARLFTLRTILIVLGVIMIALVIWFGLPLISFGTQGQYQPFASALVRIFLIVLVIVAMIIAKLVKALRAKKASDNLMAAVVKQSGDGRPSAEAQQLRERFEEAVAALKQKSRSGHTLYDLPWYVIIGAPGSGKTTALVNSGLKFPIEQRSGKAALRGVGGTRNCDWWFTDQAVLLDTAGRYTTQDSDEKADSAGWSEFLALLRKYRGRRPINGVILTISAQDLMVQSASARDTHVAAARRRLDELNRELRMQLPVYLMVTKCDLVAGFTEYFDDQTKDGRAQVWGVTFSYDQTLNGDAPQEFPLEFDGLIARLNERLTPRLEEERDVRRRARIFGFPQQMAALRDPLSQFVSEVFSSTRFDKKLLLRGAYFTSGTQEGTPIDRLLGSLGRQFAVAPEMITPGGRGKAYFIERLLTDVMFAESGLAGVNRRVEVQKAALQLGAYVAMLLVVVIGMILLTNSYRNNRSYIAGLDRDVKTLGSPPPRGASLDAQLQRLDMVRTVSDTANRFEPSTPLSMRWGLYQGGALGEVAHNGYLQELNDVFVNTVTARFRQRLIDYSQEPEKLYEYLKGYLMLGDPQLMKPEQIKYLADQEWEAAYPTSPAIRESASRHFGALVDSGQMRKQNLDQEVIRQARATLAQASKGALVYRYLRIVYSEKPGFRLDLAAGLNADRVLRRRSGTSLSTPVQGLYTKDVFFDVVSRGTASLVAQFAQEQWVWGEQASALSGTIELTTNLLDVYEKDYIATWDKIVKDIEPIPMSGLRNTKDSLSILSGPASPLKAIFRAIDQHTYLVTPPKEPEKKESSGLPNLSDVFKGAAGRVGIPTVAPGTQVTKYFEDIHKLVSGDGGGPAPIDGVVRTLGQIQEKLNPLGDGVGERKPDPNSIRELSELGNSLKRDAAVLPPAIGAAVNVIADDTLKNLGATNRTTTGTSYDERVLAECRQVVDNRYPFFTASPNDVPLENFAGVFGPNGAFDAFFKSDLQDRVNTRPPWSWKVDASGAATGGVPLSQFEAAERIRGMFFPSQQLQVRFTLTPIYLDPGAGRFTMEIDGQPLTYQYGPERPFDMTWPGPKPGLAVASFDKAGGQATPAFNGPWALFRLLDSGQLTRDSDDRFTFTLRRGEREVRLRLSAGNLRNPFGNTDLQRFRCR